jgi:hypothetical protein
MSTVSNRGKGITARSAAFPLVLYAQIIYDLNKGVGGCQRRGRSQPLEAGAERKETGRIPFRDETFANGRCLIIVDGGETSRHLWHECCFFSSAKGILI